MVAARRHNKGGKMTKLYNSSLNIVFVRFEDTFAEMFLYSIFNFLCHIDWLKKIAASVPEKE